MSILTVKSPKATASANLTLLANGIVIALLITMPKTMDVNAPIRMTISSHDTAKLLSFSAVKLESSASLSLITIN